VVTDVLLVKIGGGAALDLAAIASDLAKVPGPVVIVHGANALRDDLATRLGFEKRVVTSVSGYESVFSDDRTIELQMMAYAGLANKRIVELLRLRGRMAIGLTGLDGGLITARRNQGIRVREGEKTLLLRDRSGKPTGVDQRLLGALLDLGQTPVITVPLGDETGAAVNAENDEVVVALQAVLRAPRIIHLIEAGGLLANPGDPGSVIPRLTSSELADLEGRATGRFKRKLHAIGKLFAHGTPTVMLADGRVAEPITGALAGRGTVIAAA
jgi:acetylglutamate/LysW-gamma-L-alpha-aminoadipate kinase